MTVFAKGGPPDTPWETFVLWWGSTIVGWDGPAWGAVIVGVVVVALIWRAAAGGQR